MAESDEEHERTRNRDKFRKERSDYGEKSRNRGDYRERRTWREDHEVSYRRRNREEFEDDRDRRRHLSPNRGREWSPPPHKRQRREPWDGFRGFPPDIMSPFGMRQPWMGPEIPGTMHHIPPRPVGQSGENLRVQSNKAMLSFKQFLAQQDDTIDEGQAIQLYQEYKSDFKRKQITDFFDEHKDEDWLVNKYHPKHVSAKIEVQKKSMKDRLKAFVFLHGSGRLNVPLCPEASDRIINTMDTGVIIMEGGTEHDLNSLAKKDKDTNEQLTVKNVEEEVVAQECEKEGSPGSPKKDTTLFMEVTEEQKELAQQARVYGEQMKALTKSSQGEGENETSDAYTFPGEKSDGCSDESETEAMLDQPPPPGLEPPTERSGQETEKNGNTSGNDLSTDVKTQSLKAVASSVRPLPLHLTRSVYIRHLPAKISAEDIIQICRTIPGYLRIAFADPDPNRGYERRGWVTYSHDTDIRDVTARLTTNKVKDVQLNCMVNRELSRRVKFGQEVAWASRAVHSDLTMTLELVKKMDSNSGVWQGDTGDKGNPVLSIPASHLVEETHPSGNVGEEEEGMVSDPGTEILSEDDERLKALDRLVWYLRVVHSVDFYNGVSFPSEDCMPHRCGIFTVRPKRPKAVTQDEVASYIKSTKTRIHPLIEAKKEMSDSEMDKFGKKDPNAEVERFIEVNTQKLGENKYLCPLSGKKFKGPDFVHKHIFNKHSDKVDAVRKEAEFFNNYLRDLTRPGQQDVQSQHTASSGSAGAVRMDERTNLSPTTHNNPAGWGQPPQMVFPRGGYSPAFPGVLGGRGGFRGRVSRRGRGRKVINYHDLDAPEQEEMY